jgi:hypothetical protein
VSDVSGLRHQIARVASPVAPNDVTPSLLRLDINGELSANQIKAESILVNTAAGAKVIRLSQGAFFKDSLVITYQGAALTPLDYRPIAVSALNNQTINKSGIYQYILLTKPITGTVLVDYHAVGGEVQPDDIRQVTDLMVSLRDYLNDQVFVTPATLLSTTAYRSLDARTFELENHMRVLLSGAPNYGDASGGTAVRRPVLAGDSNFHWYTIARLYKVQGSPDLIQADQFKGRVYFPTAKVSLAFTVDVNLTQSRNAISFTTENLVFDPLYQLFTSVSVNAPVYPMARIVYSQAAQSYSGAFLQIGIPLTNLSDQMVVEDLSSTQSCWLLDKTNSYDAGNPQAVPSAPVDDNFLLPDGSSFWSSVSASSLSQICVPSFEPGYLLYSGSNVTLTQLTGNGSTVGLFNTVLPKYFPITSIRKLRVTLMSADGSTPYDVDVSLPLYLNGSKNGRTSFVDSQGNTISLKASLAQDNTGVYTVSLNINDLTAGNGNTLGDTIRYLRVLV